MEPDKLKRVEIAVKETLTTGWIWLKADCFRPLFKPNSE